MVMTPVVLRGSVLLVLEAEGGNDSHHGPSQGGLVTLVRQCQSNHFMSWLAHPDLELTGTGSHLLSFKNTFCQIQ